MRVFNRYIVFLILAACLINVSLAFAGQEDLTVYFTVNVIAYLIITILHTYLNPSTRKSLSAVAVILFIGFMTIVIIKVIEVLSGNRL